MARSKSINRKNYLDRFEENKKKTPHLEKMKTIKPFVSFNYRGKLTPAQKRKIDKYYNELWPILKNAADIHTYRPRTKKTIKAAHRIMPAFKGLGELRNFPIPKPVGKKIRIGAKNGNPIIKSENVTSEFIPLNKYELAADPTKTVERAIRKKKHKRYSIAAGESFEVPDSYSADQIAEEVAHIMARYSIDPDNPNQVKGPVAAKNKSKNHFWENWLFGIYGYSFEKQADADAYRKERKNKKGRNRGKKNIRRR